MHRRGLFFLFAQNGPGAPPFGGFQVHSCQPRSVYIIKPDPSEIIPINPIANTIIAAIVPMMRAIRKRPLLVVSMTALYHDGQRIV